MSNITDGDSEEIEIAAEGDNVIVTWCEHNQTEEEQVTRICTNNIWTDTTTCIEWDHRQSG